MAGSPYILEGSSSGGATRYFYALRKDEEGNLYIARADLLSSTDEVTLFNGIAPEDLESYSVPGKDYFDNRDPSTHELTYSRDDVKYEQWRYDEKLSTYYINDDGDFTVAIGVDKPFSIDGAYGSTSGVSSVPFTHTLNGINTNINIREILINAGWNTVSEVILVNEGTLASTNANPALSITGVYPNGFTLINNNKIFGANSYTTTDGLLIDPTDAVYVTTPCNITNTGIINGGYALYSGGTEGYAINGISDVTLTDTGSIGTTI